MATCSFGTDIRAIGGWRWVRNVWVVIFPSDQEEPRLGPIIRWLRYVGLTEAMTVKLGVVVDENNLGRCEPRVDSVNGPSQLAVDCQNHVVHSLTNFPRELRPLPPNSQCTVVAFLGLDVEKSGIASDGNDKPRTLLPLDSVQYLHDDHLQPVFEIGALDLITYILESCLTGTGIKTIEPKNARVHDPKETEVVASNGKDGEVSVDGRIKAVNLAAFATREHIASSRSGARQELKCRSVVSLACGEVGGYQDWVCVGSKSTLNFNPVDTGTDAGAIGVAKCDKPGSTLLRVFAVF